MYVCSYSISASWFSHYKTVAMYASVAVVNLWADYSGTMIFMEPKLWNLSWAILVSFYQVLGCENWGSSYECSLGIVQCYIIGIWVKEGKVILGWDGYWLLFAAICLAEAYCWFWCLEVMWFYLFSAHFHDVQTLLSPWQIHMQWDRQCRL